MASIEKRGDRYRVRWRDRQGVNRSRSCPSRAAAKALAREIEHAHAIGRDWTAADADPTADLITLATDYLHDLQARGFAEGTVRIRQGVLNVLLHQVGPNTRASALSRDALREFYTARRANGIGELTAAQHLKIVEGMWRWAAEQSDTWAGRVPPLRTLQVKTGSPALRPVAPTWAEMDAAVRAAGESVAGWPVRLFTLGRFTGLRGGQCHRLRWEDFDLGAALLYVRPELGKTPWERRGRTVPISPHLVAIMAGWGRREGLVVGGPERRPNHKTVKNAWRRAGVREAVYRQPTHAFRKGVRTGLRVLGVEAELVDHLLGHRGSTGATHYTDPALMMPRLREAVAAIPALGAASNCVHLVPAAHALAADSK